MIHLTRKEHLVGVIEQGGLGRSRDDEGTARGLLGVLVLGVTELSRDGGHQEAGWD